MDHDGMSSLGYEEGNIAAVSYFPGVGLLTLILEKKSNFVRFHSLQSILGYAVLLVWCMLVKWVTPMHWLSFSPGLLGLGFTVFMAYQAYHGEEYKLPIIGNLAFRAFYDIGPEPEDLLANASAVSAVRADETKER